MGECLVGTNNCFYCWKGWHKVRDCPIIKARGKKSNLYQASGPNLDAPKKKRFYDLRSRGEQEDYPDVVTDILQVFSINVYALLDPDATLSYVAPFVSKMFYMLPDILVEPFSVTTLVGDSVVAKRVYRSYLISLTNKDTLVDLVERDMFDFDFILGMY